MSRAPHLLKTGRTGQRMGDVALVDYMVGVLSDPFGNGHMGVTAENVAERYDVSREQQDAFAAESQARAARAIREGRFRDQILPIDGASASARRWRSTPTSTPSPRAPRISPSCGPAFAKTGSVTAGNASGLNDGAAALVLSSAAKAERDGAKPLARIVGYAHAGVDPVRDGHGSGPGGAASARTDGPARRRISTSSSPTRPSRPRPARCRGRSTSTPAKVNPNGGAIALGHPIGATGAIITVKAIYELARTGGRYGLVTMCIGGGQGIAMAVERLH